MAPLPTTTLPSKAPLVSLADLKSWNPSKPETWTVKNGFIHCTGSERRDSTASFVMAVQMRRRPNSEPPRPRAPLEDPEDSKQNDEFASESDSDCESFGEELPFSRARTEPTPYNDEFLSNMLDEDECARRKSSVGSISQIKTAGSLPPVPLAPPQQMIPVTMMPSVSVSIAVADTGSTPEPQGQPKEPASPQSPSQSLQDGGSGAAVRPQRPAASPAKVSSPLSHDPMPWGPEVTTIMIRQIPRHCTQLMLLSEVSQRGFKGLFDFLYLPYDFKKGINVGYGFINFIDNIHAVAFRDALDGVFLDRHMKQKGKPLRVHPATLQGYEANRQHLAHTKMLQKQDPSFSPLFFRGNDAFTGHGDELVDLAMHMQTQPQLHQPAMISPSMNPMSLMNPMGPMSQPAAYRNPYAAPPMLPQQGLPLTAPPMQQPPQQPPQQRGANRQPQRRNSLKNGSVYNKQAPLPQGLDLMPPPGQHPYPPPGYPASGLGSPMSLASLMMPPAQAPLMPPARTPAMPLDRDYMGHGMPSPFDVARAPMPRYDINQLPLWPPSPTEQVSANPNSPTNLMGNLQNWAAAAHHLEQSRLYAGLP